MKFGTPKKFSLQAYSVLAGTFLLSVGKAESQIIYTDVNPDVTLDAGVNESKYYTFDFDGDGKKDLLIADKGWMNSSYFAYSAYIKGRGDFDRVEGYQTYFYEAVAAVPYGKLIGAGQGPFIQLANAQHRDLCLGADWGWGGPYGFKFDDGYHAYVGVYVGLGDGFGHFGWIEVTTGNDGDYVTIHGFAYEQQPNTPIRAGKTSGSPLKSSDTISEPDVLVYPTLATDGQLNIRFDASQNSEMEMELFNEVGIVVYRKTIPTFSGTNHHTIDLSLFPNGNYYLQIRSKEKSVTQRIIVQQ